MFIEIATIITDEDGAPTKEGKCLLNINAIKTIIPKEGLILDSDDKWAILNKTYITLIGGGCVWSKHSYTEIKEWMQKALKERF